MPDISDMDLVRAYARQGSQSAFAEIVRRHINLVYSIAFRHTGNSHEAQDIAQVVFIILAQKASKLREPTVLQGWLYETTRFTAAKFLRTRVRRQIREQEAHMQSTLDETNPNDVWLHLEPLLEEAMSQLAEKERALIALRFFENRSGAEVAALLGVEEWAARKRISRAVEKLRAFFLRRGVTVSAAVLVSALAAHSLQAAPAGLASTIASAAALKGAGVSSSTTTLIRSTLKIMAWTKAKTTVVAGVIVLLAAGTTTVAVKEVKAHTVDHSWQTRYFNSQVLDRASPQVEILPAKYPDGGGYGSSNDKYMGLGQPVNAIVEAAYGFWSNPRTIVDAAIPPGKYDFIANLPTGSAEALQKKIKEKFGLVAHVETREMDVLLLQVRNSRAPALRPSKNARGMSGMRSGPGQINIQNQGLGSIAGYAESVCDVPVLDRTGLSGTYDIDLKWPVVNPRTPDPEGFKQALLDQLGLELVPSRENIKVLVIQKAD